jgi:hypothetical protein
MAADFATILAERKAQWIAQDGRELSTLTEVKRWWPDVHVDSRFAAVNYLNTKTSVLNDAESEKLFVTSPTVGGEVLAGNWRLVYAGVEEGRSGVVQVLRKGFVQTVKHSYNYTAAGGTSPALTAVYFDDSGETLNGKSIYLSVDGVYAHWFDKARYVVTLAAAVGLGPDREAWTVTDYILVTCGSETRALFYTAMQDDHPKFVSGTWVLYFDPGTGVAGAWTFADSGDNPYETYNEVLSLNPPETGWEYITVKYGPVNYFSFTGATGSFTAGGSWTGTLVVAAVSSQPFDFSEFLNESGPLWHSGSSQTVLRLPNVDPAYVEAIKAELQASASFTGSVLKFETLSGEHYFIKAEPRPENDGSYSIFLLLSKHNNSDLYFYYQYDPETIRGFFIKRDATETTLDALIETALFNNTTGALWVSGTTAGFSTLQQVVNGRTVEIRRIDRDEGDRLFDLDVTIEWRTAVDTDWHRVALSVDTDRRPVRQNVSYQQIRRRVGGELAYTEDGQGNLVGVRWNNGFDADHDGKTTADTEPAAWQALGYRRRYGDWKLAQWNKGIYQNYLYRTTLIAPTEEQYFTLRHPRYGSVDETYHITDNPIYIGTSGHIFIASIPSAGLSVGNVGVSDVWFAQDTQMFYAAACGGYGNLLNTVELQTAAFYPCDPTLFVASGSGTETPSIGARYVYSSKYYVGIKAGGSCDLVTTEYWAEVDPNWENFELPGYISRRGVGSWPCEEADIYIPILQELEREVRWDADFDLNHIATTETSAIPLYVGMIYKNSTNAYRCKAVHADSKAFATEATYWEVVSVTTNTGRVYAGTGAPASWESDGYDDTYGDWFAGWEKSFLQNYLTRNSGTNQDVTSGSGNDGVSDAPLYIGTSGHVFIGVVPQAASAVSHVAVKDVWFALDQGKFYVATNVTGGALNVSANFTEVAPALIHSTCPGMPGHIGLRGVGSYPIEEVAKIGVINGEGGYALSSSARVSFYTSPAENPRMIEFFDCTKQRIGRVVYETYFNVDPARLAAGDRRMPLQVLTGTILKYCARGYYEAKDTAIPEFLGQIYYKTEATAGFYKCIQTAAVTKAFTTETAYWVPVLGSPSFPGTEDVLTNDNPTANSGQFVFNADVSNVSVVFKTEERRNGMFAIIKEVIIRSEVEVDAAAQTAITAMSATNATYEIINSKVKVFTDLTGSVIPPWGAGAYKDAG